MQQVWISLTLGALATAGFFSACSHEPVRVERETTIVQPAPSAPLAERMTVERQTATAQPPPPAPPAEVRPQAPAPDYVWIPGYWSRENDTWVWVQGHWQYR